VKFFEGLILKLKKIVFWMHLPAGVLAGLVILFLAITGALLTYEHAIVDAFSKSETVPAQDGVAQRTVDEIANIARDRSKGAMVIMLNFENRDKAPVVVHPIGGAALHEFALNPYTGEEFVGTSSSVKAFFEAVVRWHRWLAMEGPGLGVGRAVTGAANLIFLFIVVSGIYLWLPKVLKWPMLRPRILFRRNLPEGKARNYNWHHAFSFWALIPLLIVVLTGVIISYPWANSMLYRAFGAEAPKQGGPAFIGDLRKDAAIPRTGIDVTKFATLQAATDVAKSAHQNWNSMLVFVHPAADVPIVRVMVRNGHGNLPEEITTLVFDRREGRVTKTQKYEDSSAAERARMWVRFAHTGEQFGIVGSTLAGLSSIAAGFLVYTGLALAYRRLTDYLMTRRRRSLAKHS